MKTAFTIVELMIVVSIIGILAALAVSFVGDYVTEAKESAAKDSLRIVRNMIETYAARNGVAPGYLNNNTSSTPGLTIFLLQVRSGKLLSDIPQNPFNGSKYINVIADSADMPASATGANGWIYKPAAKQFRLDWPGTDSKGVRYYDY